MIKQGGFADLLKPAQGSSKPADNKVISTQNDLLELKPAFRRLRVDLVGSIAASKVCPVELDDDEIALFCTPEQIGKDLHISQRELLQKDYPGKEIRTLQISPVMLLTLTREGIDANSLTKARSARGRDSSEVSRAFRDIVDWCIRQGASDIHLNIDNDNPTSQIRVHIDGHYIAPERLRLPTARLTEIAQVAWLDVKGGLEPIFDARTEQQGRLYEVVDQKQYMLRWGSFVGDRGPSITLRVLNLHETFDTLTLDSLGYLPSQIRKLERAQRSEGGAVVIGGVVGSGKSTTIARLLSELPDNRKIMTIEDPVERMIRNAIQSSVARDLSSKEGDVFQRKLMMLKRSAVSDVLLGEIRDTSGGRAFQDIVESGSNLYTTVHVYDMLAIPERLASSQIGVPLELLTSPRVLKLVGYQSLLPKLCPHCALSFSALKGGDKDALGHEQPASYWNQYRELLQRLYTHLDGVKIRNPEGCEHCRAKGLPELYGYAGRTVVAELFELGHHIEALKCARNRDLIGLMQVYESLSDGDPLSDNMEGKTAMDCAVYKMLTGLIDPRDVEPRFMAFESLEFKQNGKRAA